MCTQLKTGYLATRLHYHLFYLSLFEEIVESVQVSSFRHLSVQMSYFRHYKRCVTMVTEHPVIRLLLLLTILYDLDVTMLQLVFLSLVGLTLADLDHSKLVFSLNNDNIIVIMLTCPCNHVDPLTPHFYIVKLGFTGQSAWPLLAFYLLLHSLYYK